MRMLGGIPSPRLEHASNLRDDPVAHDVKRSLLRLNPSFGVRGSDPGDELRAGADFTFVIPTMIASSRIGIRYPTFEKPRSRLFPRHPYKEEQRPSPGRLQQSQPFTRIARRTMKRVTVRFTVAEFNDQDWRLIE